MELTFEQFDTALATPVVLIGSQPLESYLAIQQVIVRAADVGHAALA